MLRFKKLRLENFLSYKNLDFSFEDGLNLIEGPNMSGKSSIFEGVLFSLFGKTIKGLTGDNIIKEGEKRCTVSLLFDIDKKEYGVERGRTRGGNVFLKFFDEENNLSFPDVRMTENAILSRVKIPFELIKNSLIFTGSVFESFTQASDREKKDILTGLFGLEKIDLAHLSSKNFLREKERFLDDLNKEVSNIKAIISEKIKEKEELKIEDFEFDENKYNRMLDFLRSKIEGFEKEIKEKEKENDKLVIEMYGLTQDFNFLNQRIKDLFSLEKEAFCPTCGQKVDKDSIKNKLSLKEKEIEEIRNSIDKYKKMSNDTKKEIKALKLKMEDADEKENEIMKKFNELKTKDILRKSREETLASINNSIGKFRTKLKDFENKRSKLIDEIDKGTFWVEGFGPQGIKNFILELSIPSINKKIREYLEIIGGNNLGVSISSVTQLKSGAFREKLDVKIEGPTGLYKSCSSGERRRIDLVLLLALNSLLRKQIGGVNILILDEILDPLDSYGVEGFLNLLNLIKEEVSSIYLVTHNEDIKETFLWNRIFSVKKNKGESFIKIGSEV